MLDSLENARLTLALSIGLGLIVAGLGNTLAAPKRWRGQLAFALAGVAAATAAAWLFDESLAGWVGGVGIGVLVLLSVARAERARAVASALAAPFRSVRGRWAAAAAVGVAGLGGEMLRFDLAEERALNAEIAELTEMSAGADGVPAAGVRLVTDRGTPLTPRVSPSPRTADELRRSEARTLAGLPSRDQLIHRGKPSDDSNCHGWVFTGGRYAIGGREVDAILADHNYAEVPRPAAGDLCVYRDQSGAVAHTAVVRAVCDDGTVLVEGKWGRMGVYLHPAQSSCYGTDFRYYRTARPTHLLTGIASAPANPTAQPQP